MSAAYQCLDCGFVFPESESAERELTVLEDSMYDRPASTSIKVIACCPSCDSEDLEETAQCERCGNAEPIEGADLCADCSIVVERQEYAFLRAAGDVAAILDGQLP